MVLVLLVSVVGGVDVFGSFTVLEIRARIALRSSSSSSSFALCVWSGLMSLCCVLIRMAQREFLLSLLTVVEFDLMHMQITFARPLTHPHRHGCDVARSTTHSKHLSPQSHHFHNTAIAFTAARVSNPQLSQGHLTQHARGDGAYPSSHGVGHGGRAWWRFIEMGALACAHGGAV